MLEPAKGFFFGFFAVVHGFRRIFADTVLRRWAIVPLLAGILVFLALGSTAILWMVQWLPLGVDQIVAVFDVVSRGVIWWIIYLGLWPIGLMAVGFGLYLIARLVSAPFYTLLAERTLVRMGVMQEKPFVLGPWLALSLRMGVVSVLRTAVFLVLSAVLFGFSLIPGLNILAAIGFIHMVAFDVADYGFEAMEWSLHQRFEHFRNHWPEYSGLALGFGVVMLVPGLNLIVLPAAVVGATEVLNRTHLGHKHVGQARRS